LAEGLSSIESFNPVQPLQRQREIHSLIDQYLRDAQNRNKKPLRAETAKVRRYILNKFVKHCGIIQVGDITLPKIEVWLAGLKAEGKAKDTCWGNGQRVRSFVKYLVSKGYLAEKILTDFTVPEQSAVGRKNWIRKVEVTKVLDAADRDPVLKFALLCGFDAGLRREEISEARVGWFDLETKVLVIAFSYTLCINLPRSARRALEILFPFNRLKSKVFSKAIEQIFSESLILPRFGFGGIDRVLVWLHSFIVPALAYFGSSNILWAAEVCVGICAGRVPSCWPRTKAFHPANTKTPARPRKDIFRATSARVSFVFGLRQSRKSGRA
jgi:integrase